MSAPDAYPHSGHRPRHQLWVTACWRSRAAPCARSCRVTPTRTAQRPYEKLRTIFERVGAPHRRLRPPRSGALESPSSARNEQSMLKLGRAQGGRYAALEPRNAGVRIRPRAIKLEHPRQRALHPRRAGGRSDGRMLRIDRPPRRPRRHGRHGRGDVPLLPMSSSPPNAAPGRRKKERTRGRTQAPYRKRELVVERFPHDTTPDRLIER